MSIIKIKKLNKSFSVGKRKFDILHNIDLDIKKGQYVMIFGPSGCGKTTMLNIILGLEKPTSGSVIVEETNLARQKLKDIASLRGRYFSTIYQNSIWVKSFNVLGNVALPLYLQGFGRVEARKRALDALGLANMTDFAHSRPSEMSSGEQQRVGLARAIVTNAPIIVADEPTGNLDSRASHILMTTLKQLHKDGKTIVLVTHNLSYLAHADVKVAMKDGRIVGHFTSDSIPVQIKRVLEQE
jgi:ABC-type lipoprotein export system ATPase subunit